MSFINSYLPKFEYKTTFNIIEMTFFGLKSLKLMKSFCNLKILEDLDFRLKLPMKDHELEGILLQLSLVLIEI